MKFTLENALLCDPISKRGRAALSRLKSRLKKDMSVQDFYEKVYAQPFFVELKEKGSDLDVIDVDSDNFSFMLSGSDIKSLNDKLESFQYYFNELNSDELLYIRASAGSGKSIFLNYLKYERRKLYYPEYANTTFKTNIVNEAYELNFDLEKSQESFKEGGLRFPFDTNKSLNTGNIQFNSQWCFFIMIMKAIFVNCFDIIKKHKIVAGVAERNFLRLYENDYTDEEKHLYEYINTVIYDIQDERNIKRELLQKIATSCFFEELDIHTNTIIALKMLFRLLVIYSNIDNPNQILMSFDNIEHLIGSVKRIYDEDIAKIVKTIKVFIEEESKHFDEIDLNFASFFKIVLVIRDTTEKMIYGDVQDNFVNNDHSVCIAGWFLLERIYRNKLDYYDLDQEMPSIKFIDLITNDSLERHEGNIMNQISSMYNHNNRRTTRILIRIATLFDQIEMYPQMKNLTIDYNDFFTVWSWSKKLHIRYLCRQSVLRLIYNVIKGTYYFDKLSCNIYNFGTPQNTYARRILTWLSNKESHKEEKYYSYKEICDVILKSPDVTKMKFNEQELLDFCRVLIMLDEYRFAYENDLQKSSSEPGPNCWCQLIILKYNQNLDRNQLTPQILANEIKKQYKEGESITSGVRLTEAGYYFARKICDYEFFSCEYSGLGYPLIFMKNAEQIRNTIQRVYESSQKMIDSTILFETQKFYEDYDLVYQCLYNLKIKSKNDNILYQSIPYRIIDQHLFYLRSYKLYVSDVNLQNKLNIFSDKDIEGIIHCLNKYINMYEKIADDLVHSRYVTIDGTQIKDYKLSKSTDF